MPEDVAVLESAAPAAAPVAQEPVQDVPSTETDIASLSNDELEKLSTASVRDGEQSPVASPAAPAIVKSGEEKVAAPAAPEALSNEEKLKRQLENTQKFIQRQAAELGTYRKTGTVQEFVARRQALVEAANKKLLTSTNPIEAFAEYENIRREEQQFEASQAAEKKIKDIQVAIGNLPELPELIGEIKEILMTRDGLDEATATRLSSNIALIGDGVSIYAYGQHAKTFRELKATKAELEQVKAELTKAKSKGDDFVRGVEQAIAQPKTLTGSTGSPGPGAGSIASILTKPIESMTNAELLALEKAAKAAD